MTQHLMAFDEIEERFVQTGLDVSSLSTNEKRTGSTAVTQGNTSQTFTFSSPMSTASYTLNLIWENETDAEPMFQPLIITDKTVNGFTAKWNDGPDSANYTIGYNASVSVVLDTLGTQALSSSSTSQVVTFDALASDQFVVTLDMVNTIDSNPVFHVPLITDKTTTSFTVEWNHPTDTANYSIEYQISMIS